VGVRSGPGSGGAHGADWLMAAMAKCFGKIGASNDAKQLDGPHRSGRHFAKTNQPELHPKGYLGVMIRLQSSLRARRGCDRPLFNQTSTMTSTCGFEDFNWQKHPEPTSCWRRSTEGGTITQ